MDYGTIWVEGEGKEVTGEKYQQRYMYYTQVQYYCRLAGRSTVGLSALERIRDPSGSGREKWKQSSPVNHMVLLRLLRLYTGEEDHSVCRHRLGLKTNVHRTASSATGTGNIVTTNTKHEFGPF